MVDATAKLALDEKDNQGVRTNMSETISAIFAVIKQIEKAERAGTLLGSAACKPQFQIPLVAATSAGSHKLFMLSAKGL